MRTNRLLPVSAIVAALVLASCSSEGDETADLSGCEPAVSDDLLITPGTLTFSTNATLPPMQYVDGDEVVGMRVELVEEIATRLCLETEVMNVPFDTQIPGVQSGRWDMINTGMFYTEERAETLALVPYEVQAVAISVSDGSESDIQSVEDLAGLTIGVEAPGYEFDSVNAVNDELVAAGHEAITINTSLTNADAFQALSAGQIDGVAIVEAVTTFYQEDGRFATAISGLHPGPLAFGFAQDNDGLADLVAQTYAEMVEDGFVEELFASYGVTPYPGPYEVTTGPITVEGGDA
ncbi:ABC transporter substrate-binding protein [Occultella gossypii]|uniref:ABC transporter substrate-binding protein n=1 Tax=Occultella gossypii TaxID=2800820 RepID=A0ABS7S544_9MICO|nr:ABC transporter substrate-binding protein [Occultella gossypii]MBZ2195471.1 ABC transporter substrate-binding protein [Occultella gossypii]